MKPSTDIDLPQEAIDEYRRVFKLIDRENRGVLNPYEIGVLMRALGLSPTEDELKQIMDDYDLTNRKGINIDEFLEVMTRRTHCTGLGKDLLKAFQLFDRDGNGYLSVRELREKLCSAGDAPFSAKEFDDFLAGVTITSDEQLEYHHLVDLMMRKPS
ncbi:calmodulin, putative [Perkinsus marinus ATCC 50983]|uniref:Calmodulin n=1 Tax=Perkinsus marinus (strain ATCC 50983 / TXsc) TaxID=423536 RepID=C5L9J3_PERM5|nr:calmodulin, putative [Perkinsus marinus ATCC 50983]EER06586.1 calmodulin, putative [Perkinsus marinus ATCC 50983]|eukprot:XP_002774770.1 calmodulin, putative [Perkinsus marinus ATCC 50983]